MGGTNAGWIAQSLTKAGRDKEYEIFGQDPDDSTKLNKKSCQDLGYTQAVNLPDMPKHELKWKGMSASLERSAWRQPSLLIVLL